MSSDESKRTASAASSRSESTLPQIDVSERAGQHTGRPQVLHSRLFMQLLVLDCCDDGHPADALKWISEQLQAKALPSVLYLDVNDPRGFGLLTWSEEPSHFVTRVRPLLLDSSSSDVRFARRFAMLGRTYATGYEPDLRYWLIDRPRETVLNEAWPWAIWYPLRRTGAFGRLAPLEQSAILKEHALIGRAYGAQDLAHDVRLACHGLDVDDNEFVIGLIGSSLHPLSHVVESMRKTRQTSEFISQMGPFFVGRVAARIPG
ncbi:MAG: chlorite dismutase family protein [Proteobacteria bacterium]|nr:chlorite dismutase family protein [Pseudomonadota bacterium]